MPEVHKRLAFAILPELKEVKDRDISPLQYLLSPGPPPSIVAFRKHLPNQLLTQLRFITIPKVLLDPLSQCTDPFTQARGVARSGVDFDTDSDHTLIDSVCHQSELSFQTFVVVDEAEGMKKTRYDKRSQAKTSIGRVRHAATGDGSPALCLAQVE